MKDFINKLYRNHALIYKVLLFIGTTFLIVYLFPKSGKFKYNFEKGKPWQSESLQAPFDFAIKKTEEEINAEKETIRNNAILYFNINSNVVDSVKQVYETGFYKVFSDSISKKQLSNIYKAGEKIISELYSFGILTESYNFSDDKTVGILDGRVETKRTVFSNLIEQDDIISTIDKVLRNLNLIKYKTDFVALFFDLIEPNLTYDKSFTEKVLREEQT